MADTFSTESPDYVVNKQPFKKVHGNSNHLLSLFNQFKDLQAISANPEHHTLKSPENGKTILCRYRRCDSNSCNKQFLSSQNIAILNAHAHH